MPNHCGYVESIGQDSFIADLVVGLRTGWDTGKQYCSTLASAVLKPTQVRSRLVRLVAASAWRSTISLLPRQVLANVLRLGYISGHFRLLLHSLQSAGCSRLLRIEEELGSKVGLQLHKLVVIVFAF